MKNAQFRTVFAALLLLLPWLGFKDLYSRGEAREALVAQRMMVTDNYILPTSYNEAVPSKPPVLHWFITGASKIFGGKVSEYSARFPSAFGTVLFLLFFTSFLVTRDRSLWVAPLMLLTSFEWFRAATTARVDCLLAIFFASALLLLYRWYERSLEGAPLLAIIFLGLAALTKGPVGVLLPVFIFSLYLFLEKIPLLAIIRATLIITLPALCIASVWYLMAFGQGGQAFWDKFYYENVARFTSTMDDEPHKHSLFYLYGVFLLGWMPWTVPLLIQGVSKRKDITIDSLRHTWKRSSFLRFCLVWAGVVLIFFSIPSSKRSVYLLPAFPAVAVLIAHLLSHLNRRTAQQIYLLSVGLLFGALSGVAVVLFVPLASLQKLGIHGSQFSGICMVALLGALIVYYISTRKRGYEHALPSFGFAVWGVLLSSQTFFEPAVANQLSYRSFAAETRTVTAHEASLYSFGDEFYGFSFYLSKPFLSVSIKKEDPVPNGLVYLYEENLAELKERLSINQRIDVLMKSNKDVVKPHRKVLLVRVDTARNT